MGLLRQHTPHAGPRPCWLWPWRPGGRLGRQVFQWAGVARPLLAGPWWLPVAVLVGLLPLALGYLVQTAMHQAATALLLAPLFWACVCEDRLGRAAVLVGVVMGTHSALAIALAFHDPAGTAAILPGSGAYWEQTWHWVRTGEDVEYQWSTWLPAHLLLLAIAAVGAYTSLGAVPLVFGLEQVDLMNYYVGRLLAVSDVPTWTLVLAWHPWSVLRGLSYTVLVFELASWSLERLSGRALSTSRRRWGRWALGLGLAVADGLVKYELAPVIRRLLHANLAA